MTMETGGGKKINDVCAQRCGHGSLGLLLFLGDDVGASELPRCELRPQNDRMICKSCLFTWNVSHFSVPEASRKRPETVTEFFASRVRIQSMFIGSKDTRQF